MEILIGLALLVLAVTTRGQLNRAVERIRALEHVIESQRAATAELARQLETLKAAATTAAEGAAPSPPPTAVPPAVPPAAARAPTPPPPAPFPPTAPVPAAVPSSPEKPAAPVSGATPPREATKPPAGDARPPVPPPRRPPVPPLPPPPPTPAFDWESLIGVRLFAAIAGIAFVVGAVFFLQLSIQRGWLEPRVRVVIGALAGIALLVVCELRAARRYPVTANALDAAAIAILFSTFFAAHALWDLIPTTPTFLLLALVTAVAVLLSIRRESLFIAVLGLLGGFLTPVLLSTGENQPIPLFSYLLLLNVGLAWVAYRKHWPVLTVLSAVFTTIYQWGWVFKFLHESSLSMAMGIFLVFPAAALGGIVLGNRRRAARDARGDLFERTGFIVSAVPLAFAAYLAAIPAYGARAELLFGFLFLVDAGLLAVAIGRAEERLHAVAGAATLLVVGLWLGVSYDVSAWWTVLIAVSSLAALYLAGPIIADRTGRGFSETGNQTSYVAPLLLFAFAVLARTAHAGESPLGLFAVLFTLAALISWRAIAGREGGLYFVSAFFLLAAQATWSAMHLVLETLPTAVSLYALFGLFTIGVPLVARRTNRPLEPAGGAGVVLIAGLALLLFLAAGSVAPAAIWGLALLLAILNAALFVESASGRMPAIAIAGGALSWIVLGVWWWRAAAAVGALPALLVVVVLALVMLAGHAWAHQSLRQTESSTTTVEFRHGLFIGLVGHLFLCFVAADREASSDPWPLFGALAVLTLGVSVVAGFTRAARLHAAGAGAAGVVLLVWAVSASEAPRPFIAVMGAQAVAAYAAAWIATARGRRHLESELAVGAGAAIFLAEASAIAASTHAAAPGVVTLILAHAVNAAAILVLSWRYGWRWVAPIAVAPAWIAAFVFEMRHPDPASWRSLFAFGAALYAVFAAYPFALGRRAGSTRDPHIAAVLASGMFLIVARAALERGGLGMYVGIIPVFEGAVLALLLRQMLRQEASGARDTGRLALVAGAALAFITVAIPLQLDHQWITIGWALEGAALAWLATRVPHPGLRYCSVALLAVVFVRLVANPAVYYYEPRGSVRVFNWYLYTYAIAAASTMLAARWIGRTAWGGGRRVVPGALYTGAVITLFWLLNIEIADYFAAGPEITFRFGATVAQDLTYTLGWLVFGLALLSAGIAAHSRTARIAALALVAVTTVKCFLYDLRSLEDLYRVGAFVGLGVSLALVSLALQRFALTSSTSRSEGVPNP